MLRQEEHGAWNPCRDEAVAKKERTVMLGTERHWQMEQRYKQHLMEGLGVVTG